MLLVFTFSVFIVQRLATISHNIKRCCPRHQDISLSLMRELTHKECNQDAPLNDRVKLGDSTQTRVQYKFLYKYYGFTENSNSLWNRSGTASRYSHALSHYYLKVTSVLFVPSSHRRQGVTRNHLSKQWTTVRHYSTASRPDQRQLYVLVLRPRWERKHR